MRANTFIVSLLFFILLFVCGCYSGVEVLPGKAHAEPVLTQDSALTEEFRTKLASLNRERGPADYTIGIRDILNIEVWQKDKPEIQRTVEVRADGNVSFPLIETVRVAGKTEQEASALITSRISKYIKEPFVSVRTSAVKSKKIYVLGRVQKPGIFPLKEQLRVLDAVLLAGGTAPEADLARSVCIRNNTVLPVDFYALLKQGAMEYNIYLEHADKILVPSITDSRVFVFGEVQKPGVVFIDRELCLMNAISECSGLTPEAEPSSVRVIRGSLARPTVYVADINQLIRGNMEHNVQLRNGDIIFIPAKGIVHWHRFMQRVLPPLTDMYLLNRMVDESDE